MKIFFSLLLIFSFICLKAQSTPCNVDSIIAINNLKFNIKVIPGAVESISIQKHPQFSCDEIHQILKLRDNKKVVVWKKDDYEEVLIDPCKSN
jgi:hypothetical protein